MDEFLDECDDLNQKPPTAESRTSTGSNDTQHMPALLDRIKELELKLEAKNRITVKKAKDHFAIGEFDGKSDGADYLKKFEAECERYEIQTDDDKIKILGDFCKSRAATWYTTSERVLSRDWTEWTSSFKAN